MNIGILYICTGKYSIFWEDFFTSSEKFFLPGLEKTYFVFTDASDLIYSDKQNVKIIYTEKKGWPYDTLMRYHDFVSVKAQLEKCDYLFFFNANALFVDIINKEEFLPDDHPSGIVGVLHPGYFNVPPKKFPYEKEQRKSTAFIKRGEGKHYYAGGINGGKTNSFLQLSETLQNNIQKDLDNNLIAVWHDESHINRYFLDNPPKTLSPSYVYPEDWQIPFQPKILIRNKSKLGGHDQLRGVETTHPSTWKRIKKWIINKIRK
jgi:hypothetical protein